MTISTSIAVTWMRPVEYIIHAARLPVDTISVALDDPQRERHIEQLRERSRAARTLVYQALRARDVRPDHNLLLTAGLRDELMQLHTEQLLWEIVVSGDDTAAERRVVLLASAGVRAGPHLRCDTGSAPRPRTTCLPGRVLLGLPSVTYHVCGSIDRPTLFHH